MCMVDMYMYLCMVDMYMYLCMVDMHVPVHVLKTRHSVHADLIIAIVCLIWY